MTEFFNRPKRNSPQTRAAVFRINGESLTYAEIGLRLGISDDAARSRMKRLRLASGAITFERLRAIGA